MENLLVKTAKAYLTSSRNFSNSSVLAWEALQNTRTFNQAEIPTGKSLVCHSVEWEECWSHVCNLERYSGATQVKAIFSSLNAENVLHAADSRDCNTLLRQTLWCLIVLQLAPNVGAQNLQEVTQCLSRYKVTNDGDGDFTTCYMCTNTSSTDYTTYQYNIQQANRQVPSGQVDTTTKRQHNGCMGVK